MAAEEGRTNGEQFIDLLFKFLKGNISPRSTSIKTVGDKLKLIDKNHLNYFIDFDSNKQLAEKMTAVSDAIIDLFTSQEMIVTEVELQKVYNCGHCSEEHIHDIVIFIPGMNKRYYVSSDSFEIV